MKDDYRKKIRSIAEEREIGYLLHFTQTENLAGIVKNGLLPRRALEEHMYLASDRYRLDDNLDAVSVSISQYNKVMFETKRKKSGHDNWLILGLSRDILWTHNCRFCWRNAARKEIKSRRWLGGPWAFAKMFARGEGEESNLPVNYPTDPEAEVQVLEPIAPKHILGAIVNHPRMVEPVQGVLRELLGDSPIVMVEGF